MLNIVVPMAGRGSRFATAGFALPKPLIDVGGLPMIQLVVDNLTPKRPHRFVFLCLEEHIHAYPVKELLRGISPGCEIVTVPGVTQGAACTVLLAQEFIDNSDPLMIANSDQWVGVDINTYLDDIETRDLDGLIMTMRANDPKWSFVRLDKADNIIEVVEKEVVSEEATVGIYNFRKGSDFVNSAQEMIRKDLRVNNEFYVAPCYNEMIGRGDRIGFHNIGSEGNGMHGLGIPSDLETFLSTTVAAKAINRSLARSQRSAA